MLQTLSLVELQHAETEHFKNYQIKHCNIYSTRKITSSKRVMLVLLRSWLIKTWGKHTRQIKRI